MRKNPLRIAVLALVSMFLFVNAGAQNTYKGGVTFTDPVFIHTQDGMLQVNVTADFSRLELHRQQAVVVTPALKSTDVSNPKLYDFTPVAVSAKTRYKVMKREQKLQNSELFDRQPAALILRENGKKQTHDFIIVVPYESWMDNAELIMIEDVSGCGGCEVEQNEYMLGRVPPLGLPVYIPAQEVLVVDTPVVIDNCMPDFRLSLIMPSCDDMKVFSETYSAWFHFEVNKYEIRRDIGNNAQTLWEVDQTINRLRNNKNISSISIFVKGYASPEGDPDHNLNLSRNRAMEFVKHLRYNHGFSESMINFAWMGEDWNGLRAMVDDSDIQDRMGVINAIDFISSPRERKARIKSLSGGKTYQFLLNNYYPVLRRDEYTITYTIRPFELYEVKSLLKTDPTQLSLYEMYKLASTYTMNSYEFREVFDIAARVYPTDPIALVNASALDIAIEADDVAVSRIYTLDKPEAWNNLAIAYFKKGFYDLAEEYFEKAAAAGEDNGINNLKQFRRWEANPNRHVEITPGVNR